MTELKSDDAQHTRLVQTLLGVYSFYDRELTELAIRLWIHALEGIDTGFVEQALQRHLRDPEAGRFLPKPADVIRQLRGEAKDVALVAWGRLITGASGGFEPGTPERLALDAVGGMRGFGLANESDNGYLQRRFVEAFIAYQRRADAPPLLLLEGERGGSERLRPAPPDAAPR